MSKRFLFEFEDLPWFPSTIRESMLDYLRLLFRLLNLYEPVPEILSRGLRRTNALAVVDLCSGGGGPIEEIAREINKNNGSKIPIILTDKFPNVAAFKLLSDNNEGVFSYCPETVDAADVPLHLTGFRTMFSSFHHFDQPSAKAVLQNAVSSKSGIGIFDGGDKNILIILGIILLHPVALFVLTPFIRPFRFSRLFFTYLVPLIPLCTIWDGIMSILKLRSPAQLMRLAAASCDKGYTWQSGKIKNKWGMNIAYLLGYPKLA